MSTMTDQFSTDLQAVETDLPVSFVFNGKTYIGQKDETQDSIEMMDAGYLQRYDFELLARTNIFTSGTPAKNDTIQIGTVNYRVESVTASQDGVALTFHMKERNDVSDEVLSFSVNSVRHGQQIAALHDALHRHWKPGRCCNCYPFRKPIALQAGDEPDTNARTRPGCQKTRGGSG
jgi:hypothetical protein